MKMSFKGGSAFLKKARANFQTKADRYLEQRSRALKEELVVNTPVETGEAQKGWDIRKEGPGYVIQNNVEHIKYLNQGSSKQAPAYFIENTALKYGTPLGAIVESTK